MDSLQRSHGTLIGVHMAPTDGRRPEQYEKSVWLAERVSHKWLLRVVTPILASVRLSADENSAFARGIHDRRLAAALGLPRLDAARLVSATNRVLRVGASWRADQYALVALGSIM